MKHRIYLTESLILWLGSNPNRIDQLKMIIQMLKSKGKPETVGEFTYKSYLELCFFGGMRLDMIADNIGIGVLSKEVMCK